MANPVEIEFDGHRVSSENPMPISPRDGNVNLDGQTRSAQTLTLFDGKIMNAEDTLKWDTKGTGTATYSNNAVKLIVAYAPLTATQSVSGAMQAVEY